MIELIRGLLSLIDTLWTGHKEAVSYCNYWRAALEDIRARARDDVSDFAREIETMADDALKCKGKGKVE